MLDCARDQRIDLFPAADIASNDMRIAARLADAVRNSFAGVGLAAGDDDLRAHLR